MDLSGASDSKAEARRRLRARRAQITDEETAERARLMSDALESHVDPSALAVGYLPFAGEPDVLPFLRRHAERGGIVVLPLTPHDGSRELQWGRWTPETPLREHPVLPLREPDIPPGSEMSLADLPSLASGPVALLVPALAIDESGARMGQGGGFYDTTLSSLSQLRAADPELSCEVIGVVHHDELLRAGSFPVEAHDLRVQAAVTEKGLEALGEAYNRHSDNPSAHT